MFDSDVQDVLLFPVSLSGKHDLHSFWIVSKFQVWKGRHFLVGIGRHFASLRHCYYVSTAAEVAYNTKLGERYFTKW